MQSRYVGTFVLLGLLVTTSSTGAQQSSELERVRLQPATVPGEVDPPPHATVVNFDESSASCGFENARTEGDRYATQGVVFEGPLSRHGGVTLVDYCEDFPPVSGYSAPNLLAFDEGAVLIDGGVARGPETLRFTSPASYVQVSVGSPSAATVSLRAYGPDGDEISVVSAQVSSAMTTIIVAGQAISSIRIDCDAPRFALDDLAFLVDAPDADGDGLSDAAEGHLGTDPSDSDSDEDALLDGFESRYRFDPLIGGEGTLDPDGDGLENVEEQVLGTHPRRSDTDRDGLDDASEGTAGTSPLRADVDQDGLEDGTEVNGFGTDPRISDTDGGGVADGEEIGRATNPLNSTDDSRTLGLVLNEANRSVVSLDPNVPATLGSLQPNSGRPSDCVISSGGQLAFMSDGSSQVRVLEPLPTPRPAPGIASISMSGLVRDLARSPDDRYVLACGFSGVSVIQVETRSVIGSLQRDCTSIDVCADGSVLVGSGNGRLSRFVLAADGSLGDTGEWIQTLSSPDNVYCAPDARSGIALDFGGLRSFRFPGMHEVSRRSVPQHYGASGAFSLDGERFFVLSGDRVAAFSYDLTTAILTQHPVFTRSLPWMSIETGIDALALDPAGARLHVPRPGTVEVLAARDGEPLVTLQNPSLSQPAGICFLPLPDADRDGLTDLEERSIGTDPAEPDSDSDGLADGFERRNGLDPLQPGNQGQDPDQDGLDNLAEQSASTSPNDPDSDDDDVLDALEVADGTDPLDWDTDGDAVGDGSDNCPLQANRDQRDVVHPNDVGDVCDDPDQDAYPDSVDNCPDDPNAEQVDADEDGVGDPCDPYPLRRLEVYVTAPPIAFLGFPAVLRYRLVDAQTGQLASELSGVRTTVTVSSGAVFGAPASEGILISGGGTTHALVEFVAGVVELPLEGLEATEVALRGEDTEWNGVSISSDLVEDFENSDAGFTQAEGNGWEWGVPSGPGPGGAASGQRVWATNLDGPYPDIPIMTLRSPRIRVDSAEAAFAFQSWFSAAQGDRGYVEIVRDSSMIMFDSLDGFEGGYHLKEYPLDSFTGQTIRVQLRLINVAGGTQSGWYVDDFTIRGIARTVRFMDPDGDADEDGLSNAREIAAGTDPDNPDSDVDGNLDGADNCPLLSNRSQRDTIHPNDRGDHCEDPDQDGRMDATDNCPDTPNPDQANEDGDEAGDICDPCLAEPRTLSCLSVSDDGGACLETSIELMHPVASGTITIERDESGPPVRLVFEVMDATCFGAADVFEFRLNGQLLGTMPGNPESCQCEAPMQSFVVEDPALLASLWHVRGTNTFGVRKSGFHTAVAWVRVRVEKPSSAETACLWSDTANCLAPDLCRSYSTHVDVVVDVQDNLANLVTYATASFSGTQLPEQIDLPSLEEAQGYLVCVSSHHPKVLYGTDDLGGLYTVDVETAQTRFVARLSRRSEEVEYDPQTGRAFNQSDLEQHFGPQFDVHTGEPIGSTVYTGVANWPALEWVGRDLYGAAFTYDPFGPYAWFDLRILDPLTGQARPIAYLEAWINGLAYDEAAGRLYGIAQYEDFTSTLVAVDLGTGELVGIGTAAVELYSLEFGPDGLLYAGCGNGRPGLCRIDVQSGSATLVGYTQPWLGSLMLVDEPSEKDCRPFLYRGETTLSINGAPCVPSSPPHAAIAGAATVECSSTAGGLVQLDGSGSTDPDEDIASYDWFKNFGEPQQAFLGSGPTLDVTLAVGSHAITLRVTDAQGGQDTETVVREVVDKTPPTLTLASSPTQLWPPNHRMMDIVAEVTAHDVCGPASIVLQSVTSSEPDDAPGPGDGHTVGDIQGASVGTADVAFALRAERRGTGQGRTYTIAYGALDGAGNATQATMNVVVPHHLGGATDPVKLALGKTVKGTTIQWPPVPGAQHYNVVRADAAGIRLEGNVIRVGPVTCLASGVTEPVVADPTTPAFGRGFVYLVEYVQDGWHSSYGAESVGRERVVMAADGGCP